MTIITIISILCYSLLIVYVVIGLEKYKPEKIKNNQQDRFSFSVIIACKNEEKRILPLLKSISKLDYKKRCFELIFVNDHSDDGTYELINKFKKENDRLDIKLLNNTSSTGKKSAIQLGIDQSKYDFIITTDADCYLPSDWLTGFNQHLNVKKSAMIIAPVVYSNAGNFLEQFQHDDFLSLQAITIATAQFQQPILCNGANICYRKSIFYEVSGFEQHQHIASGDDVLLMESFINNGFEVDYIKTKVLPVITQPVSTWKQLLHQRKRWSSKISRSSNKLNYWLLLAVGAYSLIFLVILISVFYNFYYFQFLAIIIISKWILDYILFASLSKKVNVMVCFRKMMMSSFIYPVSLIFLALALVNKVYVWKGQKY